MKTNRHQYLKHVVKLAVLGGMSLSISGCIVAMPPAMQVASLALDGMSYLTTGKSVTDHAISTVADQDCAMMRGLRGEAICTDTIDQPQMALLPDGAAASMSAPMANEASMTIIPANEDLAFQSFAQSPSATASMDLDEILSTAELNDLEALDMALASGPDDPVF